MEWSFKKWILSLIKLFILFRNCLSYFCVSCIFKKKTYNLLMKHSCRKDKEEQINIQYSCNNAKMFALRRSGS